MAFVAIAALAVGLATLRFFGVPTLGTGVSAWAGFAVLMTLAVIAEAATITFSVKRGRVPAASISTAAIPRVAIVPLFGPFAAIAATAVSEALSQFIILKRSNVKAVFNTAQLTLAIGLGSIVYVALGGPVSATDFDLNATVFPLGGLIVGYFLTNTGLVSTTIALDTGRRVRDIWRGLAPIALANDVVSSSFSLIVVFAFAELGVPGLLIVLLPLLFVHQSYGLYLRLERRNREILELLVKTIEAKDPYTSGHSQRVATLTGEIAAVLGLHARKVEEVETAALLHDIGKIDIAYSDLVRSPAELSATERQIIQSHPDRGAGLLASVSSLNANVLEAVRHHHEYYGGGGYPDGLSATEIPLAARIIMIADTVDAMLSDRPYRAALTVGAVRAELRRFSGRQFDPVIVEKCLEAGLVEPASERARAKRMGVKVVDGAKRAKRVSTL